ncbi:MAG: hypothetical protein SPI15_05595 [Candidatus Faecousia sp.]|nr:hypothetical protein [Clostridiales bacterium]MDY6180308.1 hypothetical protein [Candidatus Faecousia sp.]
MLTVYGMMICPDCVKCREELDGAGVLYEFRDFAESTKNLKEFLALRDTNPIFEGPRREGKIGIPCLVTSEGWVTLSWDAFLEN